ncbi:hypothetical protein QWY16_15045 [Planococcus shenhongbingii]|uniref:hypothetical protein n=1 Tax=Planococcus shenhongbingii TaxID=3058398 RepID=UPI002610DFD3|nr:hypothetical protein [Planococcus sp. N016]WKA57802.1 hypothetical protein QWY16_15045 [Planococcus sp. N016]
MSRTNQVNIAEAHTIDNQVIFFKSQDEFAKALREGIRAFEETGFIEELAEKE